MMFLNHNIKLVSLVPQEGWQKCFDKGEPIGSLLGKDVFIFKVDPANEEDWNIYIGFGVDNSSATAISDIVLPGEEDVIKWFEARLREEAEKLLRTAELVGNVRLYGALHPPAPPVTPSWETGTTEPVIE